MHLVDKMRYAVLMWLAYSLESQSRDVDDLSAQRICPAALLNGGDGAAVMMLAICSTNSILME